MSATQFTRSNHKQHLESAHHQRGQPGDPGDIAVKVIYVGKIWPGMHTWAFATETVANRRRRWMSRNMTVNLIYNGNPPFSDPYTQNYSGQDRYDGSVAGDGFCAITETPLDLTGTWATGWTVNPGNPVFYEYGAQGPIAAPEGFNLITETLTTRTWFNEDTSFGFWEQSCTETLGTESLYPLHLEICLDAMGTLSFNPVAWDDVDGRRLDEYGIAMGIPNAHGANRNISAFNPADFTGDLITDDENYFVDTGFGDAHRQLDITFWETLMPDSILNHPVMTSLWVVEAYTTVNGDEFSDGIYARKSQVKCEKTARYFIAEGDFTENGQLANPVVVESGVVNSNAPREIPMPDQTTIAAGMKGRVAFIIVGESPANWEIRTGISLG